MSQHLPARPSWTCTGCGKPWPCLPARDELLVEYVDVPIALALYLTSCFLEAMAHQPGTSAELYRRFLGWLYMRRALSS
jgi:hypothetical protein